MHGGGRREKELSCGARRAAMLRIPSFCERTGRIPSSSKKKKAPEGFINTIMATMNAVTRISQANKDSISDIVLTPNTFGIGQMAFGKKTALKAIEEGEKEAEKKIQEILKLIK